MIYFNIFSNKEKTTFNIADFKFILILNNKINIGKNMKIKRIKLKQLKSQIVVEHKIKKDYKKLFKNRQPVIVNILCFSITILMNKIKLHI